MFKIKEHNVKKEKEIELIDAGSFIDIVIGDGIVFSIHKTSGNFLLHTLSFNHAGLKWNNKIDIDDLNKWNQ